MKLNTKTALDVLATVIVLTAGLYFVWYIGSLLHERGELLYFTAVVVAITTIVWAAMRLIMIGDRD